MSNTSKNRAAEIMQKNANVLHSYFVGLASCDYYDGNSYQLYLDLDDDSMREHMEASSNSWLQRDDGSMIQIIQTSGYADTPEDERYTEGCDLNDYGYAEWLDHIEQIIAERLSERETA